MSGSLRWLRRGLGALLVGVAVAAAGFYLYQYLMNYSVKAYLPTFANPTRHTRVLVVAPHPDDEVLGAGGYTARTLEAGGRVRVVVVTSGTGFRRAAIAYVHRVDLSHRDFLHLGYVREQESLEAEAALGVRRSQIDFLGFPDMGTQQIWERGFTASAPYRDPNTGASHVPFAYAFRPGAPYDAQQLQDEIKTIIQSFKPTIIFLPDPNDFHPDHRAASEFTLAALATLDYRTAKLCFYLVHDGEWPTPIGYHPAAYLIPPRDLLRAEVGWSAFPLDPAIRAKKRIAIARYRTQTAVMGDFLLSFDRRNELFLPTQVNPLPRVSRPFAFPREVVPPVAATLPAPEPNPLRTVEPGSNLTACLVFNAGDRLWAVLRLHGTPRPGDLYRVALRTYGPLGGHRFNLSATRLELDHPAPAGATFALGRAAVAFSLPDSALGNSRYIFIAANAASDETLIWTPWRLFAWVPASPRTASQPLASVPGDRALRVSGLLRGETAPRLQALGTIKR